MIFPPDFEQRLGFDQLRERLASNCLGEPGKRLVSEIRFQTSIREIQKLQQLSLETMLMRERGEDFPMGPYADPRPWQEILELEGAYLELPDLFALMTALQMVVASNAFLLKDTERFPTLTSLALPEPTGKKMLSRLRNVLDEEGKVKDSASPELSRIRKRIREEERNARRVADQIMRQALENGWAPEGAQPTIREGRLVVPLLAEHKRKIKGYQADQSATGQTIYLEPAEVLEANNDLRDLLLEEKKEVIRILRGLTDFIRTERHEVQSGFGLLASLDFQRTKASLARDLSATLPAWVNAPAMRWENARHPLLYLAWKNKRHLEPLQIELTDADRFLLVSGPNAGGKSVCLKTVGLIQYMAQCGFLVPMNADSVLGVFDSVFLDIGDQQSIESDLSTYSSHLKNMATFIKEGNAESLMLMDELGSGTDPNFGGGIAQAVLSQLMKKRAWGLATTHYYNLKVFAGQTPGIRNASMQFDTHKLAPLFRLETGQPGSSFALEIAAKTGLTPDTLKDAERFIGKDLIGLDSLVKEVADEKVRLSRRESEITARESQVSDDRKKYDEWNEKLASQEREILNRAKTEAASLLQETNREIEKTIRHIRENKAEKQETRKVREGLKEILKKVKPLPVKAPQPQGPLKAGDKVRLMGGDVTGTILSLKKTTAVVQFGNLRSTVKLERLVRSDQAETLSEGGKVNYSASTSRFSPQLDVRGMRVEELLPVLTRFLDDAVQFGMSEVTILHGKGEGVLRSVVRDSLKRRKEVSLFKDEHADRGGAGVTIVSLK